MESLKNEVSLFDIILSLKTNHKKGFRNYMKNQIIVQDVNISISKINEEDFISLTDLAKYKNPDRPEIEIQNWLKNKKTLEFLSSWEEINNQNFKHGQMTVFLETPNYRLSVKKFIAETNAIGIISKRGRYGGTYAQKDIGG